MTVQIRRILGAFVFAAATAAVVEAASQVEPPQQPPKPQTQPASDRERHDRRMWWKTPADMAEIGLTAEQSTTIDGIFKSEVEKMKPLRETLNQLERSLDETVRANTADVEVFAKQVHKIEKMRAELNTMRTVMLYRMRRVLTQEQNAKFRAMWDRREAERRKQDGDRHR